MCTCMLIILRCHVCDFLWTVGKVNFWVCIRILRIEIKFHYVNCVDQLYQLYDGNSRLLWVKKS